jgi:hypothetical protein
MSNLAIVLPCLSVKNRVEDVDTDSACGKEIRRKRFIYENELISNSERQKKWSRY